MKNLFRVFAVLAVLVISLVVTDAAEASSITTSSVYINVDGVYKKQDVVIKDERIYLPLRAISDRFAGTSVQWYSSDNRVEIKLDKYRVETTYDIYLNSAKGPNYIHRVNPNGRIIDSHGSFAPVVYNNTTYLAIRDMATIFGAQIEWSGASNTVHILYIGKSQPSAKANTLHYVNAYQYLGTLDAARARYESESGYYKKLGVAFSVAENVTVGGFRKTFKALGMAAELGETLSLPQLRLMLAGYQNFAYKNGMKLTMGNFTYYTKVEPQTIKDIK